MKIIVIFNKFYLKDQSYYFEKKDFMHLSDYYTGPEIA